MPLACDIPFDIRFDIRLFRIIQLSIYAYKTKHP